MSGLDPYNLRPFVDRLLLRSELTEQEVGALLALPADRLNVQANRDISRLAEEARTSCYVASGLIGRFGQTREGERQLTALHIPGDLADLHSAVRPIGVGGLVALSDTTILSIHHDAIRSVASTYPAIAEAFWRDCMVDMAALLNWTVTLGRGDAAARLAHIFCEMALRYAKTSEPLLIYQFPVTQQHLADLTGLTSVHVNRSLRLLRETGLVSFTRGVVEIADWQRLARAGDFDPIYLVGDTGSNRQHRLLIAV